MIRNAPIVGQKFGRWTIVEPAPRHPVSNKKRFICRCDCGTVKVVRSDALASTRSCGCLAREMASARRRPDGCESQTPEYAAWRRAIDRCTNPNNKKYKYYGGRGIKVCARWMESYEAFLADVGRKPSPELSIDRIDNDGDYEPGNVRWGTSEQQNNNRRSHRIFVEVAGTKVPLAKIARSSGLPYSRILNRLRRLDNGSRHLCSG
jgi:hypothetical protein